MAKKKRRLGSGVHAPDEAGGQIGAQAALPTKRGGGSAPIAAAPEPGAGDEVSSTEAALMLRAVAAASGGSASEALSEALQPLVAVRAAKYEEDTRAAKLAEAAQGNPANARAGNNGPKKRQAQPAWMASGRAGADAAAAGATPLKAAELSQVASLAQRLADRPAALASKECKQLRSALHPLVEARVREERASPAFRVTCALGQRSRWPEALRLLADMRALELPRRPKLGAYQRWVREINAAHGEPHELAMLDAIMRVAAGLPSPASPSPAVGSLHRVSAWKPAGTKDVAPNASKQAAVAAAAAGDSSNAPGEETISTVNRLSAMIASRRGELAAAKREAPFGPEHWTVIAHEEGPARLPPNRYPLDIYMCKPGALELDRQPSRSCERHPVPGVPGAFMLSDVMSRSEIDSVRKLTEAIGYRPDLPLSSPLDDRAQNVVLFATEGQNDALFERVRELLPQELGGDYLVGINRRWRIYRYQEGNAYRKHLDGAWPASGLRVNSDGKQEYLYDAHGGHTRSRFTFIIYLNDDFEGGCTTYFVPRPGVEGCLEERPVRPVAGNATVFPHGDHGVPLLHEGSPVLKGAKYLLRTDVVYATRQDSAAVKEAKRIRGLARQLGGLGGKDLAEEMLGEVPGSAAAGAGGSKKKVIKKMKPSKFREKQEARMAKQKEAIDTKGTKKKGLKTQASGKGSLLRFNRTGTRPKKGSGKRR